MKTLPLLAVVASLACLAASPVHASATYTTAGTPVDYIDPNNTNLGFVDLEATYDSDISSTDLVEEGSASLDGSPTFSVPNTAQTTYVYAPGGINDGAATSYSDPGEQGGFGPHDAFLSVPETVTFNLTAPYDIGRIQLISGYSGGGFSGQSFTVGFETTGSPDSFQDIGGNLDPTVFTNAKGFQVAETEITDTTGTLGSDVTAIQFNFTTGLIIRELDVFAVPEPGTWALMIGGLVALLGFIRFSRKAKA